MNPDVVVRDAGLETLARRAHGREALLVPRLLESDGRIQRSAHPLPGTIGAAAAAPIPPALLPAAIRTRMEPFRSDRARTVGWAIAACVAARTELLRRLGPFDARDFLFYEDMDLCLRAAAAGVPTELHPDVRVVHTGGRSDGAAYGGEPHELLARRRREVVARAPRARGPRRSTTRRSGHVRDAGGRAQAAARAIIARERAQLPRFLASRRRRT